MKGLVRNVRHMKQIIASHQTMAKSAGQAEQISLAAVLSHAMGLSFQPEDEKWIIIRPDYQQVPTILVDQHQLLQILVNLLRNAKQAMRQQVQDSHELNLSVKYQDDDDPLLISLAAVLSHAMGLSFQPEDEKWIIIRPDYQQVPTILVDQHQLLQILVNLLRNAKQAMRQQVQDSHELNLSVKYQDDDEASVVMTIQDSGIGIAPEHLSKMFTRGFTTKTDGNGIGLHSSILAIQNMGGSMHVQSEGVGRGATFTLTFPVQKAAVSS